MPKQTEEAPWGGAGQTTAAQPVLIQATSLRGWFREGLTETLRSHGLEATAASEQYVVSLLDEFNDADQLYGLDGHGRRKDEALAMMLHEAVFGAPGARLEQYRRLGDVALYVAGLFAESLRGRSVGVTYYIDMGQGAYSSASGLLRQRGTAALRELYEELADTFGRWVEVLRGLSERLGLAASLRAQETGDLYERLLRVKGQQAQLISGELVGRGVLPLWRVPA